LTTGVALIGAGVIAVTPLVPTPNIEPAAPHVSASVELAALENPIQVIAQLVQQSIANTIAVGGQVLSDPAPILQQILTNQIGNASSLAGSLQQFIANSFTAITVGVPQQVQMALQAFGQGQITDGLNDLVGVLLLPVLGEGLSNFGVFQDIFTVIGKPVQNLLNVINAGPSILLSAGIGPIEVLSNVVNAVGNGAEGLIAAVQSGNPVNVANAVIDGVAGLAGAAVNSVVDPNTGIIAAVLNLRKVIAQALGAPLAFAVKEANALPVAAAKTVTLSTAPAGSTSTASKTDGAASGAASTGSATDAAGSSTASGTESKSGAAAGTKNTDGKGGSGADKTSTAPTSGTHKPSGTNKDSGGSKGTHKKAANK
jgi:hypothetical protein